MRPDFRAARLGALVLCAGAAGCWDNNIPTEAPRPTVVGGRIVRVTGSGAQDTVLTSVPVITVRLTDSSGAPVAGETFEVRFLPTTQPLTQQQVTLCSGPLAVVRFGIDTAVNSTPIAIRSDANGAVSIRVARGCRAQTVPIEFFVPRLLLRDTVRFVTLPGRSTAFDVRARQRVIVLGQTDSTVVNVLDRFANGSDAGTALLGDTGIAVVGRAATATSVGDWVVRSSVVIGGSALTDTARYSVAPPGNISYVGFDTLVGFNTTMSSQNRARVRLFRTPVADSRPAFVPNTLRLLYAHPDTGATTPTSIRVRFRLSVDGTRPDVDLFSFAAMVPPFYSVGRAASGQARVFAVRATTLGNRLVSVDTTGAPVSEVPTGYPNRAIAVAPAADQFVEGYDQRASVQDSVMTIRDLSTGAVRLTVRGFNAVGFVWTPSADRVVAFTIDNELVGIRTADGTRYGRCPGASANFAISPDGRYAGWLTNNQLSYCDLTTGRSTVLGCVVPTVRCNDPGPVMLWRADP
jgi:hypothetical protein